MTTSMYALDDFPESYEMTEIGKDTKTEKTAPQEPNAAAMTTSMYALDDFPESYEMTEIKDTKTEKTAPQEPNAAAMATSMYALDDFPESYEMTEIEKDTKTEKTAPPKPVSPSIRELEDLGVTFPEIKLDEARSHPNCRMDVDCRRIWNKPVANHFKRKTFKTFSFLGTCSAESLSARPYWQVLCQIDPTYKHCPYDILCQVGLATLEDLHKCLLTLALNGKSSLTFNVFKIRDCISFTVRYDGRARADELLVSCCTDYPLEITVGFLLDTLTKRVFVFNVNKCELLCEIEILTCKPLYPVVNLLFLDHIHGSDISLSVESGRQLRLPPSLVAQLKRIASNLSSTDLS